METTIMTGDRLFAEKVSYHFADVQPGDIVVFSDPQVPSRVLVKRVIAHEDKRYQSPVALFILMA